MISAQLIQQFVVPGLHYLLNDADLLEPGQKVRISRMVRDMEKAVAATTPTKKEAGRSLASSRLSSSVEVCACALTQRVVDMRVTGLLQCLRARTHTRTPSHRCTLVPPSNHTHNIKKQKQKHTHTTHTNDKHTNTTQVSWRKRVASSSRRRPPRHRRRSP
jgi:hypothetical protein